MYSKVRPLRGCARQIYAAAQSHVVALRAQLAADDQARRYVAQRSLEYSTAALPIGEGRLGYAYPPADVRGFAYHGRELRAQATT